MVGSIVKRFLHFYFPICKECRFIGALLSIVFVGDVLWLRESIFRELGVITSSVFGDNIQGFQYEFPNVIDGRPNERRAVSRATISLSADK